MSYAPPRLEKQARLDPSIAINQYLADLEQNEDNIEAWKGLIHEAFQMPCLEARPLYKRFLDHFPTSGVHWAQWVQKLTKENQLEEVDQVFMRELFGIGDVDPEAQERPPQALPSLDLWRAYLNHVRNVKRSETSVVKKAYNIVIDKMGIHPGIHVVFLEYIEYMNVHMEAVPTDHIMVMRKAYHRALQTPMPQLDTIWNMYEKFEYEVDRNLAKDLLENWRFKFNKSKTTWRDRKNASDGLDWEGLPASPGVSSGPVERTQVYIWKRLLSFEKQNPMNLDHTQLQKTVTFFCELALLPLYRYTEIWYDYARFHADNNAHEEADAVYKRALVALPQNLLIHFTYCDYLEGRQEEAGKVTGVYQKLVQTSKAPLAIIQYLRYLQRAQGSKPFRDAFLKLLKDPEMKVALTGEVYSMVALTEYYCNDNAKVALNVFKKGKETHFKDISFLTRYIDFVIERNDHSNVRVLFEMALDAIDDDDPQAYSLWTKFREFEIQCGDLASIAKIERRMAEKFPQDVEEVDNLAHVIERYPYGPLIPCYREESRLFGRVEAPRALTNREQRIRAQKERSAREAKLKDLPRPDSTTMVEIFPHQLAHSAAGKVLSRGLHFSPNLSALLNILPRADLFPKPHPGEVDKVVQLIRVFDLPDYARPSAPAGAGPTAGAGGSGGPGGRKRKYRDFGGDSDDEDTFKPGQLNQAHENDLYGKRQQQKLSHRSSRQ